MGKKRMRGQGVLHDEVKVARTYRLTDTAYEAIKGASEEAGSSQSEFIEQWARSLITTKSGLEIIKAAGFSSVSQFLEELGRGNAAIIHRKPSDKMAEETQS